MLPLGGGGAGPRHQPSSRSSLHCYGWGLGLAPRFAGSGPWFVLALWAGISAVLLAAAPLWLRHADRGPLELMVHRLQSVAGTAKFRARSSTPAQSGPHGA